MATTIIFDSLIKALEKFVQITLINQESKQRIFNEIIDPLYEDLEMVIGQYFNLYNTIYKYANEGVVDEAEYKKQAKDILNIRSGYLDKRRDITALTEAILESNLDESYKVFASKTNNFFFMQSESETPELVFESKIDKSDPEELAKKMKEYASSKGFNADSLFYVSKNSPERAERLARHIRSKTHKAHRDWIRIKRSYAKLKIESIS